MSKRTVAVVDYGMGNLRSVAHAVGHGALAGQDDALGSDDDLRVGGDHDFDRVAGRRHLAGDVRDRLRD